MKPKILLIGDVIVDVTLTHTESENKMRLGGIMHAARALWALGIDYGMAYIAPDYLQEQIEDYSEGHGAVIAKQIGKVSGAPNVVVIAEPKEIGQQGYDLILRNEYQCQMQENILTEILTSDDFTDIIILTGQYPLDEIVSSCNGYNIPIHVDTANWDMSQATTSKISPLLFRTIFLSTSSPHFLKTYNGSVKQMNTALLGNIAERVVFKENRGGSRFFESNLTKEEIEVEAQVRDIVHSVGVGDVYDVVFVSLEHSYETKEALTFASHIAAEYASTTYPDTFKLACKDIMRLSPQEVMSLTGVSLPWEKRSGYHIYIAGPDFDYINTKPIDFVENSLRYHNFSPRRPIKENGQMEPQASKERKRELFNKDMHLLDECQLVLAVLLNNDPGTLIEIGLAAAQNKPVLVYDPYNLADNLMLTELPYLLSSNLDSIIRKVFELAAKDLG